MTEGVIFDELFLGEGEIAVLINDEVHRFIGRITLIMVAKNGHLFSVSVKRAKAKPRVFNARYVIHWTV